MLALIPLFPLIGFLINGGWYAFGQAPAGRKKASAGVTGTIASLAILASFALSVSLFLKLHGMGDERVIEQTVMSWMQIENFKIDIAFRLDSLSALFILLITGVGSLIHIYSIGYMGHDETPGKFFAYLNLFCFAMLVLVLGSSLPMLFFGWEGVGLCSYLLIGYWYTDEEKASAGKKAFIVNRVGDLGFLLAMFFVVTYFGTLDFAALKAVVAQNGATVGVGVITTICLLFFVGCMGKSAQIPLYVWLPDAMAGPTPVSALIHAATMVTSGVYLVSRLNFMYSMAPTAMNVVAIVGAFTALFAATIAIAQRDIKKVLAYSTVSQLGYMFLACGVGAYTAGVFHVITHGFFKALMFLGAGSVIHGMHEEQDIMKMGGLRKDMPITFLVFGAGWLAICGIPPFSGFFSKDEILWMAFSSSHGSTALWFLGAVTAVMTAFYMTRLFSLTFFGKSRNHDVHAHESPLVMTIPLMVLALLSIFGGFMGVPHRSWIEHWLEPVIPGHAAAAAGAHGAPAVDASMEYILMGVSVAGAVLGIVFALGLYKNLARAEKLKQTFAPIHKLLENKWYVDELYEMVFIKPIRMLCNFLWKKFDVAVIDRVVLSFGHLSSWTGQTVRMVQTGSLQVYAVVLVIGLLASVGYLIYGLA
ncbi:NADH-quinone oxidoreductase subunit L [bacterium]|nr:NADH-quinone oxidoreductase subunit L [bacterium]